MCCYGINGTCSRDINLIAQTLFNHFSDFIKKTLINWKSATKDEEAAKPTPHTIERYSEVAQIHKYNVLCRCVYVYMCGYTHAHVCGDQRKISRVITWHYSLFFLFELGTDIDLKFSHQTRLIDPLFPGLLLSDAIQI